ncbi:MAG TPA: hypothetical protein VMT32_16065 [Bryobacteraceae bacterium]|nr:hypothetical protein [Bryobacteraceae bacterium]
MVNRINNGPPAPSRGIPIRERLLELSVDEMEIVEEMLRLALKLIDVFQQQSTFLESR